MEGSTFAFPALERPSFRKNGTPWHQPCPYGGLTPQAMLPYYLYGTLRQKRLHKTEIEAVAQAPIGAAASILKGLWG